MRNADEFSKEYRETFRCETGFKEVHSIININLLLELWRNVRSDVVLHIDHYFIILEVLLIYWIDFRDYNIITLFLFDHLYFLHVFLFSNFLFLSLLLWVLKCRTCFLLGFSRLGKLRITGIIDLFMWCLLVEMELLQNLLLSGQLCLSENNLYFGIHFSIVD